MKMLLRPRNTVCANLCSSEWQNKAKYKVILTTLQQNSLHDISQVLHSVEMDLNGVSMGPPDTRNYAHVDSWGKSKDSKEAVEMWNSWCTKQVWVVHSSVKLLLPVVLPWQHEMLHEMQPVCGGAQAQLERCPTTTLNFVSNKTLFLLMLSEDAMPPEGDKFSFFLIGHRCACEVWMVVCRYVACDWLATSGRG